MGGVVLMQIFCTYAGGARRIALGGTESVRIQTEPSQTYSTASARGQPIIEKRPTNTLISRPLAFVNLEYYVL